MVQYTNLVFQGGGARGIAYVGVIKALDEMGVLGGFNSFAASSAGSFPATMLACGATSTFVQNEFSIIDTSKLFDSSRYLVKNAYDICANWAVCAGEELQAAIDGMLKRLVGDRNITFAQIYERFGNNLIITGTSLAHRKPVYFSHLNYPSMPVRTAMRISCSIPFVYPPVEYEGDMWVDGGLLDNYPMRAFHVVCDGDIHIPHTTLGVALLTDKQCEDKYDKPTSLYQFASAITYCVADRTQSCYLEAEDWDRSIKVHVGSIGTTHFNMTETQRNQLVDAGTSATHAYFASNSQYVKFVPDYTPSAPLQVIHDIEMKDK